MANPFVNSQLIIDSPVEKLEKFGMCGIESESGRICGFQV